jgi:hypothetical protein
MIPFFLLLGTIQQEISSEWNPWRQREEAFFFIYIVVWCRSKQRGGIILDCP